MRYFAVDLTTLPASNVSGKTIYDKPTMHFKRYLHDNELFLVTKGSLNIQQCDNITVSEGEILFNLKEMYQTGTKASVCTYYWLHFDSNVKIFDDSESAVKFCTANPKWLFLPEHFKLQQLERVETLWLQLNHYSLYYNDNSTIFRDSLISAIIADISFQITDFITKSSLPGRLHGIMEYINIHITEDFSLASLSEMYNYNEKYLSVLIHKYTGKTFKMYITEIRIKMAINYLLNGNEKIRTIAIQTGFGDEYYFMKVFKKITGVTPTQYRKTYGGCIYSS